MRFLEFLLGAAAVTSVLAAPAAHDAPTPTIKQKRKSKFQFTGVNESGGEFGNSNIPGQLNKDYTWPAKSSIDVSIQSRDRWMDGRNGRDKTRVPARRANVANG